jgi:hypothetical protein
MAVAPTLFGATVNPIAIDLNSGQTYVSTDYVDVSFAGDNGTFTYDNEIQWFSFSIASTQQIYLQTISWATMDGFTPILTLFNADGSPTGIGGSGSPGTYPYGCGNLTVVNELCLDAFIQATLDPGNYLLALTQVGNESLGSQSDGFLFDAVNSPADGPNYTSSFLGYGAEGPFFASYAGNPQLTGVWALSVGTPEPSPAILLFSGLLGLAGFKRLRKVRTQSSV